MTYKDIEEIILQTNNHNLQLMYVLRNSKFEQSYASTKYEKLFGVRLPTGLLIAPSYLLRDYFDKQENRSGDALILPSESVPTIPVIREDRKTEGDISYLELHEGLHSAYHVYSKTCEIRRLNNKALLKLGTHGIISFLETMLINETSATISDIYFDKIEEFLPGGFLSHELYFMYLHKGFKSFLENPIRLGKKLDEKAEKFFKTIKDLRREVSLPVLFHMLIQTSSLQEIIDNPTRVLEKAKISLRAWSEYDTIHQKISEEVNSIQLNYNNSISLPNRRIVKMKSSCSKPISRILIIKNH